MTAAPPLLSFVHVPKTGGTSLEGVFYENDWSVFHIRSPRQASAFLALPRAEQDACRAVFGHMPFGIDRYVERPVSYITFLRDPVDRVLSAYAHNLRHPDEPGAETVRAKGFGWTAQPSNFMCRFLADHPLLDTPDAGGRFWWDKNPPDFAPRDLFEQAKANLDRCDFIGLTETYDDDVRTLSHLAVGGLEAPGSINRHKVSGAEKLSRAALTADQFEAIRAANHLDLELYDYALELRRRRGGPHREPRRNAAANASGDAPTLADPGPSCGETDLVWRTLPDHVPAGPQPLTLTLPRIAYGYGGATNLLRFRTCRLKVRARALQGVLGLVVTTADGGAVLQADQVLTPEQGEVELEWSLTPELTPAILIARNLDPGGAPGEVRIEGARYTA